MRTPGVTYGTPFVDHDRARYEAALRSVKTEKARADTITFQWASAYGHESMLTK